MCLELDILKLILGTCPSSFGSEWSLHYKFEKKTSKFIFLWYEWWNGYFPITEYKIPKMSLTILVISNIRISNNIDYIHCLSAWTHWRDAFIWLLWSQGQWPFPELGQEPRLLSCHLSYMKCWGYDVTDFKSNLCDDSIAMFLAAFIRYVFCLSFSVHTQRTSLIGFILQNTFLGQIQRVM